MSRRLGWLVAVAALIVAAPAGAAVPRSIPVPEAADAVAYAPGRVLWAEHAGGGPIIVRQARVAGGPPRSLAAIAHAGDDVAVSLAANGTGFLLAVRDRHGDRIVFGDGSPARTLVDCPPPPRGRDGRAELSAVAGTAGFAFAGASCGTVSTVAPDGRVAPVPGLGVRRGYSLAYAEPRLGVSVPGAVRVIDLATGAERRTLPGYAGQGSAVALLEDGTLVSGPAYEGSGFKPGIYAWPPSAGPPRLVADSGAVERVYAAGGRAFFDGQRPLGLAALSGSRVAKVGAPGAAAPDTPLGFDGTSAAFRSVSCRGASQVTVVDVDEPRAPGSVDGCPVRLARGAIHTSLRVTCRNGCTGTLRFLRVPSAGHPCDVGPAVERVVGANCPTVASARLSLAASPAAQPVTVRFARGARRERVRAVLEGGGVQLAGSPVRTLVR